MRRGKPRVSSSGNMKPGGTATVQHKSTQTSIDSHDVTPAQFATYSESSDSVQKNERRKNDSEQAIADVEINFEKNNTENEKANVNSSKSNAKQADKRKRKNILKRVGIVTAVAVGTGAAAVIAAPFVIAGVGFGAAGVVAGSLAAGWQSGIGAVAAGSLFASLQSAGAVGLAASTSVAIGATAATTGASITAAGIFVENLVNKKQDKAKQTQELTVKTETVGTQVTEDGLLQKKHIHSDVCQQLERYCQVNGHPSFGCICL